MHVLTLLFYDTDQIFLFFMHLNTRRTLFLPFTDLYSHAPLQGHFHPSKIAGLEVKKQTN